MNVNSSFTNNPDTAVLLYYTAQDGQEPRLASVRVAHRIGDYTFVVGAVASENKWQGLGLTSLLDVTLLEAAQRRNLSFFVINENSANLALHRRYAQIITDRELMGSLGLPLPQITVSKVVDQTTDGEAANNDSGVTLFTYDFR